MIDFGRSPFWNCPAPEEPTNPPAVDKPQTPLHEKNDNSLLSSSQVQVETKPVAKWQVPPIQCFEPENRNLYVHIGPSGGAQGYSAITGMQQYTCNNELKFA